LYAAVWLLDVFQGHALARPGALRQEYMSRYWKIVVILLVLCITLSVVRLFLMGRLVDAFVRLMEALGRLGRS
jgi:uncharacterized membrane protein